MGSVLLILVCIIVSSSSSSPLSLDEDIMFWEEYTTHLVEKVSKSNTEVVSRDPLMLRLNGFLSQSERNALIETQKNLLQEAEKNSVQRWCFNGKTKLWLEEKKDDLSRIDINEEDVTEEDTYCTISSNILQKVPIEIKNSTGSAITFWGETLLEHSFLNQIETKIEKEIGLPIAYGAPSQLLHYTTKSQYKPHLDCVRLMKDFF